MSEGILLFDNGAGGGGSGSNLYDQTSFADTSLAATSNSGFSSTVGTNPLGEYFANDLAPKWMAKTLWIRDLVRVEDRSLWINGRPTYKIIWNEQFPGADGYLFGDIVASNTGESRTYMLTGVGDGFGVGGVIRRVQWLFKPSTNASTTAQQYLDGVATTTLSVGGLPAADAVYTYPQKNFYNAMVHAATNETRDIHDYRITANQFSSLQVQGVVVYYNVSGDGLDCFAGTGYLNKTQVNPVGSTLSFPQGVSSLLGGVAGVQFNTSGAFGLTTMLVPSCNSIAIGTINTNLLSVSTGTGASFPVGSAIYVPLSGGSYYLGVVSNVSSDVLTVGPTLAVGISGTISQVFKAGASFAIGSSMYSLSMDYQPGVQNRGMGTSFMPSPDLLINQSSPSLDWRVWGFTMGFVPGLSLAAGFSTYTDGLSGVTLGLVPTGISSFLQIDGNFSALEAEWMVGLSVSFAASFVIDGLAFTSLSEGASLAPGLHRRVLFTDAGVGWHSARLNWGGSTQVALTRLRGYNFTMSKSVTLGLLAEIPIGQTFLPRTSANGSTTYQNGLTTMAWGPIKRIYADSLPHSATWTFVDGKNLATAPGGVQLATTTAGQNLTFQYFGTQYSIIGNPGATVGITADGIAEVAGSTFNTWLGSGLTLGFHTVVVTARDSGFTTLISAIDFLNPAMEVRNLQNMVPNHGYSSLVRSFVQSSEPEGARAGDMWFRDPSASEAYQRSFGGWNRMALNQPACTYGQSLPLGYGPNATVPVRFDFATFDGGSFGSIGATLFIMPSDGNYLLTTSFRFVEAGISAGFGSLRSLFLVAPSVTPSAQGSYLSSCFGVSSVIGQVLPGSALIPNLKKGSAIGVAFFNNSGVTLLSAGGNDGTFISIQRVGP